MSHESKEVKRVYDLDCGEAFTALLKADIPIGEWACLFNFIYAVSQMQNRIGGKVPRLLQHYEGE